jgi:hypothetical protein
MLFEVFSQRYERGSTLVTSNLPFDEWTSIFGSERLTGALLDRLTHHVHILEMNGQSYRLATSKKAQPRLGSGAKPKNQNTKRRRARHRHLSRHKNTIINRGFKAPSLSTRLVQYLAAIWHILSPPLTFTALSGGDRKHFGNIRGSAETTGVVDFGGWPR